MAVLNNFPLPLGDPIGKPKRTELFGPRDRDPQEGRLSDSWVDALTQNQKVVEAATVRIFSVTAIDQGAPIAAVDMTDGSLTTGLYEVKYYLAVSAAAGVGTQLDVTFDWQDRGVARTFTSAKLDPTVLTDNTSAARPIRVDAGSPVRYSTNYDGNQTYDLRAVLMEVEA